MDCSFCLQEHADFAGTSRATRLIGVDSSTSKHTMTSARAR